MIKTFNYKKEEYRGTIKQIMKVRGLRAINLDNYFKFVNENNPTPVHSIKANFMNGYVDFYDYAPNGKPGKAILDGELSVYEETYNAVMKLLENENKIPSKVKRNILVKVSR